MILSLFVVCDMGVFGRVCGSVMVVDDSSVRLVR